ncbi:coatomer subunit alpha-like protein [Perkinsela sp. CCAP 1560/4]|nr:coatomer subunit alpha-like protein [Perkinsela sp. CCAP 1560/4]|eukprot:KNH07380.1 coatomer subunit alpha-like protein [Perkinsela sp. CCAP 1560/4]
MHIQFQFEKEENRVKGLSFHASQPLLAVGLHNGHLEVWDVETKVKLLANECVHNGPIRSVDFHPTQCHMLCSGGDDTVVRVWSIEHDKLIASSASRDISYSTSASRCLKSPVLCASLAGHTDYIRSTQFHPKFPWILSASDDQTMRIWDWSNRSCLVVCHGHEHYVMCARFHPAANFIVSASLDSSIRVWDMTNLVTAHGNHHRKELFDAITNKLEGKVTVRHVIEAHEKGVNWVSLHPSEPLFVTASDDRSIRLWSADYEHADFQEIGCIREHTQNVTCCVFDTAETMVSCGEDGDVCLWDLENKRQIVCNLRNQKVSCDGIKKTHRERYWTIATHQSLPYVAAGNDFGFDVFCHSSVFPVCHMSLDQSCLTFFESREMKQTVLASDRIIPSDKPLKKFKKASDFSMPHRIDVSPDGKYCLYAFSSLVDSSQGGFYALHRLDLQRSDKSTPKARKESFILIRDCSGMPVFISADSFAHIDGSQSIALKDFEGELRRTISNDAIQHHLRSRHGESMLLRSIDRLHSVPTGGIIVECSTTHGLLWCCVDVETENIVATRIFGQGDEAPQYAIWKQIGSLSCILIVFQTQFLVCDADLSTVCSFRTHGLTIDSAQFDSGSFMGFSKCPEASQIVYFTVGSQLLYGIIPSGRIGVLKSFPSRVRLLDGNIDDGNFLISVPTKGLSGDSFCLPEELNTDTTMVRVGDGIFRASIDPKVVKLEILSNLPLPEDISLIDTFTDSVSQLGTLPFSIVRKIVDSPIPAVYSLRLLRTLDASCSCVQDVQKWLFELACKFFDVHFAFDRLTHLVKLTELGPSASWEADGCLQTMWKTLAALSVSVGEFNLARSCYGKLSSREILPWISTLFMAKHSSNDSIEKGDESFHSVLHELLAGKAEKAADSLAKLGFSDLAQECHRNALSEKLIERASPETRLRDPIFRLDEYYTLHEEAILQEVTEENRATPADVEILDLIDIPSHETQSKELDDPLDFIFDSSESD